MPVMGRLRDGHGGPSARPRYKRLGAAGGALAVTLVAVLGGMGILPSEQGSALAAAGSPGHQQVQPAAKPSAAAPDGTAPSAGARGEQATEKLLTPTVPVNSGSGRRIVFAMGQQRVWLVDADDDVRRTYLVSGSVTDNLHPGSYSVYSKSMHAIGVDDSGTMRYMVRFTQGDNAAIGFHDIPVLDHALVQGRDDLGTPQSHGCIRQWRPDAKALWSFAPVGTPVVVVA
jgi:lipoprotein-anchoring transpeptidase ErfK/SrfK